MHSSPNNIELVRIVLVTGGVFILALLLWQLSDVVLLVFAAILIATILRSLSDIIAARTPLQHPFSLALSVLIMVGIMVAFFFLLGTQIWQQFGQLGEQAPELLASVGAELGIANLSERVSESMRQFFSRSSMIGDVAGYTKGILGGVSMMVLVLAAGIYFALSPETYRDGFLQLVPPQKRDEVGAALNNAGNALRYWLLGQLAVMVLIGVVTTIGLYLLGMPNALALGFIAGLLEFVPYVGPILAAVPALFIAFSEGGNMIWYVLGLYVLIQQAENILIIPLVQRQTVDLPPVLGLFALIALGIVFGPMGVVLGIPITVVLLVMVKQLYVREALGEVTSVPGEDVSEAQAEAEAEQRITVSGPVRGPLSQP